MMKILSVLLLLTIALNAMAETKVIKGFSGTILNRSDIINPQFLMEIKFESYAYPPFGGRQLKGSTESHGTFGETNRDIVNFRFPSMKLKPAWSIWEQNLNVSVCMFEKKSDAATCLSFWDFSDAGGYYLRDLQHIMSATVFELNSSGELKFRSLNH